MATVLKRDSTLKALEEKIAFEKTSILEKKKEVKEKLRELEKQEKKVKAARAKTIKHAALFFLLVAILISIPFLSSFFPFLSLPSFSLDELIFPISFLILFSFLLLKKEIKRNVRREVGVNYRKWRGDKKKLTRLLSSIEKKERRVKEEEKEHGAELKGCKGESAVTDYIEENFGHKVFLINDINITDGKRNAQIDHVLICPQGIFCLETKNYSGAYHYVNHGQWAFYKNGKPVYVNSAQGQSVYHANVLRDVLGGRLRIIPVVVFANKSGCFSGEQGYCRVIKLEELREFIDEHTKIYSKRKAKKMAKRILKLDINRKGFWRWVV